MYAEVPEDWVEAQKANDLSAFLNATKEMIKDKAIDKLVDKIVAHSKIDIKISNEELKQAVINRMAEKALEKSW